MLLFLMIPLTLLAFGVAVGPVLAMTVVEHRREALTADVDAGRIPWDLGGPRPVVVPGDRAPVRRT